MIRVNKKRFYEIIGCQNVEVVPRGDYPYTTEFKLKSTGRVIGKVKESYPPNGVYPLVKEYFIEEDQLNNQEV